MTSSTTGTLYVCATPIGNLSDCSTRLISTLKSVDCIAAEDTRVTQQLLRHFEFKTPLISLQKFNEASRVDQIAGLLSEGKDVALVSDAGTPALSDPGALLVGGLIARGFRISPIPGPSSITTLLSVAGLPADLFYFGGFFPRKEAEATTLLASLQRLQVPLCFLESPKRIVKTLGWLTELYPTAKIVLGKELTKTYEWFHHGTPASALEALDTTLVKGEWCFVTSLPKQVPKDVHTVVSDLKSHGLSLSQVVYVTQSLLGLPKNTVYNAFHESGDITS